MSQYVPPTLSPIAAPALAQQVQHAIDNKTKPPGSLGRLESLALQIALIQQSAAPRLVAPAMLIFAADHGIHAEQVSPYPQSVTWQMVENFLAGGAAINVFARQSGCELHIVDAGVKHDFGPRPGLIARKIGHGTANFAHEMAMSLHDAGRALAAGSTLASDIAGNVLGFGEMGIGNTTTAAALMHLLTGLAPEMCVGAGTGMDAAGVQHKAQVIRRAVLQHQQLGTALTTPVEMLAAFGGFEIAMMVGAMLGTAAQRKIILVDGFIVTTAVLVAAKMQPAILDYCVFAHASAEQGHQHLLAHLQVRPLLALEMRLGEGTGCALALPLLHAATNFLNQMASFESASVSQKGELA